MSIAHDVTTAAITDAERARRRRNVDSVAHSSEMEGLRATDEYRADADVYVSGAITADELVRRTLTRYGVA